MPVLTTQPLGEQIIVLLLLAIPVACISWTITHEEIFREAREFCSSRSKDCQKLYQRKLFFALTCEYCISHYLTAVLLVVTRYRLLFEGWRGYLIAGFSVVWVANFYMALFGRLRLEIKSQKVEIESVEEHIATEEYNRRAAEGSQRQLQRTRERD